MSDSEADELSWSESGCSGEASEGLDGSESADAETESAEEERSPGEGEKRLSKASLAPEVNSPASLA